MLIPLECSVRPEIPRERGYRGGARVHVSLRVYDTATREIVTLGVEGGGTMTVGEQPAAEDRMLIEDVQLPFERHAARRLTRGLG